MHLLPFVFLAAQGCDLSTHHAQAGLEAKTGAEGSAVFTWQGEHGQQLRATFAIRDRQPVIAILEVRGGTGGWVALGKDLSPEYEVTTAVRRLSEQQMAPLRKLKIELTPEVVEHEKWNAFWDAPLNIPGSPGGSLDLPRKAEEIRRLPRATRI